tara:strand:- start:67 stop:573 length:507 start_codon:yes stop_codon:yes gene_type:complete
MGKKFINHYNINLKSLSEKDNFSFDFSKELFSYYDKENDLKSPNGTCNIQINKRDGFIEMHFNLIGNVILNCDRSLKEFNFKINKIKKIIIKFEKINDEINDEIVFVKQNTDVINVSKFIYEFFLLSIPLKRIHPSLVNENNIDNFVFSTKKKKENRIDPRFKKLKKL